MNNLEQIKLLSRGYRRFLLELGEVFQQLKEDGGYEGFADTFIDMVKSPEIGFTPSEAERFIKMYNMFGLLEPDDLPSHHSMAIMVNKKVDMGLLESAQTLSVTDFKELIADKKLGTQDRTYKYEIIKRSVETGSIKKVYGEELEEAVEQLRSNKLNN